MPLGSTRPRSRSSPPPVPVPVATAALQTAVATLTPMSSPSIKILGVPVGDPASSEALAILHRPVARHRRLATLVRHMADAGWPHAALRLLQIAGVRRYAPVSYTPLPPPPNREVVITVVRV